MDNATYHAHSAVSKSHLDLVAKSPTALLDALFRSQP
jgi:hypothetical protein